MPNPVQSNTDPRELQRRLQASGPMGFIISVYETLKKYKRPYYYTGGVPEWLHANLDNTSTELFTQAYGKSFSVEEAPKGFVDTPHAIIHQYRMYPSNVRYAGTTDAPTGARRQKTPSNSVYHDRPLPGSSLQRDIFVEYDNVIPNAVRALRDTGEQPPLWDSKEQVPDIIRDYVEEDSICYVWSWKYDVFVDFTLVAANMFLLEQMHNDLLLILRTFHDRAHSGASNLTGWFYGSVSGAPTEVSNHLRGDYPVRTITWRLQQTVANAFPIAELEDIALQPMTIDNR